MTKRGLSIVLRESVDKCRLSRCLVHGPPQGLGSNSLGSLLTACDSLERQIRLCGRAARLKECVGRGEEISLEELRSINWPADGLSLLLLLTPMKLKDPVCHQKLNSSKPHHKTYVVHLPVLNHPAIDRFLQGHPDFHDLSCQPAPKISLGQNPLRPSTQSVLHLHSDYRVLNVLGKGGMATVYGLKGPLGTIALKVQSPPHPLEFYILQQLAQRLPCPDLLVVRAHAIYIYRSSSLMLLDHVNGNTLLDSLNSTRAHTHQPGLAEPLALLLSMALLEAVLAIHRAGIVHGDLKLDNVLMSWDSQPKAVYTPRDPFWHPIRLIDFGRSLDLSLWPKNIRCLGTWPPQPHDMPDITTKPWSPKAIDYWAVASMAHLLLFGQPLKNPELRRPIKRYWHSTLWDSFFESLFRASDNHIQKVLQDIQECLGVETQRDPRLFKLRMSLQQDSQKMLK
ncbi:kinase-like domain-containing protein [Phycomyces nitens]|nr:kinase-like domain-containing protein [Phycomyces nitens]